MVEIQVVTQSSVFGELEFGTPSRAAAFDSWYAEVYAPVPVDGSGTDNGSINLSRPANGEHGTVVSDNLYSGGKDFLEPTGVITDTRNGLTGVPAEWMRGGTVDQTDGNTLTLSNGSNVVLEGGQVVSGENVYAYNPEFGSVSLPSSDAQLGAVDLPTEIAITGGAVADAALPFGNVAAGLAPTPNQALIVEFGVLSPSESLQAPQMQAALHASDDLPQSMISSSGGSTDTSGADAALSFAANDSAPDSALPHAAASAQETGPTSNSGIKVDAPTAAAGAVAAGTVVHGGAAAPALRRPLPTL